MGVARELMTKFYQHLGELFYAIAKAYKTVGPEKGKALKESIRSKWGPLEKSEDEPHEDASFQIEAVFDFLNEGSGDAHHWFENIRVFKETQERLFTEKVNQLIIRTANSIASSLSVSKRSELYIPLYIE